MAAKKQPSGKGKQTAKRKPSSSKAKQTSGRSASAAKRQSKAEVKRLVEAELKKQVRKEDFYFRLRHGVSFPVFIMLVIFAGLFLAVNGIYVAQSLSPAEDLPLCLAAAILAGGSAWYAQPLLCS